MQFGTQSNRAPGPLDAVPACLAILPSAETLAGFPPASAAEIPASPRSPAPRPPAAHLVPLRRVPYQRRLRAAGGPPALCRERPPEQNGKLLAHQCGVLDPPRIQSLGPG